MVISIHKALAGLDLQTNIHCQLSEISIHKALAGLDATGIPHVNGCQDFNPQGPRGPRREAEKATQRC